MRSIESPTREAPSGLNSRNSKELCYFLKRSWSRFGRLINIRTKQKAFAETIGDIDECLDTNILELFEIYLRKWRELVDIDVLIRLYNQEYFWHYLAEELKRSGRYDHLVSVLMINVDDFEEYVEAYGPAAINEALKEIAESLRNNIREVNMPARYGLGQFAIILLETDKNKSLVAAKGLGKITEERQFKWQGKPVDKKLTLSIGIATFPDDAFSGEDLVLKAKVALSGAEREGKNRICLAERQEGVRC